MAGDDPDSTPAPDRREPVGAPVVRGDPEITGAHAEMATKFDPDDPVSLSEAAEIVTEFMRDPDRDSLAMLEGAAACAALVRGEGSYKAAAARTGASVNFLRTWARVHDLPISIRRCIARGQIMPSAAKHIGRLSGNARFLLAWAVLDCGLSVHDVREIASEVNDGRGIDMALAARGITLGEITASLSVASYRELWRFASLHNTTPSSIIESALEEWFAEQA